MSSWMEPPKRSESRLSNSWKRWKTTKRDDVSRAGRPDSANGPRIRYRQYGHSGVSTTGRLHGNFPRASSSRRAPLLTTGTQASHTQAILLAVELTQRHPAPWHRSGTHNFKSYSRSEWVYRPGPTSLRIVRAAGFAGEHSSSKSASGCRIHIWLFDAC